jgi:O-antigen/teichoic acid export membrane protein
MNFLKTYGFWLSPTRIATLIQRPAVRIFTGLAWRNLAARILSAMCLLVAAHTYELKVFADFGVYLAVMNIIGLLFFLRYESAIVGATSDEDALLAIKSCLAISILILAMVAIALLVATQTHQMSWLVAIFFVIGLAARGSLRLAVIYATRCGDFAVLARSTMIQAIVQPVLLLALLTTPLDGLLALVISDAVGHLVAMATALWLQRKGLGNVIQPVSMHEILGLLKRWISLPLFNLPGTLMSSIFISAPLVLTPMIVDATTAGAFALAYRLLDFPTQLIGAAATPVVMNLFRTSNTRPLDAATRWLLAFSAVVLAAFGVLAFASFELSQFVTSPKWSQVLHMIPFFALFSASLAIAGPLYEAGSQFQDQRLMTIVHGLAAIAGGLAFMALNVPLPAILIIVSLIAFARALAVAWRVRILYGATLAAR